MWARRLTQRERYSKQCTPDKEQRRKSPFTAGGGELLEECRRRSIRHPHDVAAVDRHHAQVIEAFGSHGRPQHGGDLAHIFNAPPASSSTLFAIATRERASGTAHATWQRARRLRRAMPSGKSSGRQRSAKSTRRRATSRRTSHRRMPGSVGAASDRPSSSPLSTRPRHFCSRVPSALRHLLRQARQVGGDKRGRAAFRSGTSDNCIGNDKPRRSGACAGAELFNASILVFPA